MIALDNTKTIDTKYTIVPTPFLLHPPHLPNNNTMPIVALSPAPVLLSGRNLREDGMSPFDCCTLASGRVAQVGVLLDRPSQPVEGQTQDAVTVTLLKRVMVRGVLSTTMVQKGRLR